MQASGTSDSFLALSTQERSCRPRLKVRQPGLTTNRQPLEAAAPAQVTGLLGLIQPQYFPESGLVSRIHAVPFPICKCQSGVSLSSIIMCCLLFTPIHCHPPSMPFAYHGQVNWLDDLLVAGFQPGSCWTATPYLPFFASVLSGSDIVSREMFKYVLFAWHVTNCTFFGQLTAEQ